uniref:Glutaredoxin 1 n=1 Tax=Aphelenchoides fragariae TaxID=90724 RepID=H9AB30_9BILA|nr:glutaredoxin 1 [Aphelenchoides fragariae]
MSVGKAFVDSAIKQYKVVGFSKSYCPYCKKAKEALDSYKFKEGAFGWIEIEDRKDMDEIQDYLKELTGARSVPRVFINQKFFGGGDDTKAAHSNGKLEKALQEAQAI